jgi:hypothetical protein
MTDEVKVVNFEEIISIPDHRMIAPEQNRSEKI